MKGKIQRERISGRFTLCDFLEREGLTPQNAFILLVGDEVYDVFYYQEEGKRGG